MVRFRIERLPLGVVQKLYARSSGPYKILNKVGPNAYILDIPINLGINFTFNLNDFVSYHGHSILVFKPYADTHASDHQSSQPIPPLPPVPEQREEIEAILPYQIISTR